MMTQTIASDQVSATVEADRREFVHFEYPRALANARLTLPVMFQDATPRQLSFNDKVSALELALRDSPKVEELLLYNYVERGNYWNAGISLELIKSRISREKYDFYAEVIKGQAMQNNTSGGANTGHAWLVEVHKKGWLKGHISKDELKECVNVGFWELMNEYFYPPNFHLCMFVKEPDMNRYDALMSYSKYLDLSRTREFREKFGLIEPLEKRKGYLHVKKLPMYEWPDSKYKEAVNRALGRIGDRGSEAWLLCPIIEQILYSDENQPCSLCELSVIKDLEPYEGHLHEPAIRAVIGEAIAHFREEFGC